MDAYIPSRAQAALSPSPNAVLSVSRVAHGIEAKLERGTLRIEFFEPFVVRVRQWDGGAVPEQRVPVVVGSPVDTGLQLEEDATEYRLASSGITVHLSRGSGQIAFSDPSGVVFAGETSGSRSLEALVLPGATPLASFRSRTGFRAEPDEAFYGLGQHQEGYLDYRGTVVNFEQQNREVAIPFAVSSKGYGILWNNAAFTQVNVCAQESTLAPEQFEDENGKPGALTGRYYAGENFENLVETRRDEKVLFDWSKTPPVGLPHDHYSVRWTGSFESTRAGDYYFRSVADDGVKLWIDDTQLIDNWAAHPTQIDVAKVHLDGGGRHRIRFEFFQRGGESNVNLSCFVRTPDNELAWNSEAADCVDYLVFRGPKLDDVVARYRSATGQAPLPPKWALGFWQSKERYQEQSEWEDILGEYRKRQLPIDNIVQDWFYWDPKPWGSHWMNPVRFPDPAKGVQQVHERLHAHIMISVWGMFDPGSQANPNANYEDLLKGGFLYPRRGDQMHFYDAFNPAARKRYWELMRDQLYDKGFDAWWLDASEPEVDMKAFRQVDTGAGRGALVLNAWPLMHTIGVSEGQLQTTPNRRPFILTRSAFAGQQRTGASTWSGDITATWRVFADQIPAGLNFSMSGIPYWCTDIGAFFVPSVMYPGGADNPAYRELFTRWFEYGAFCPIFRVHGTDFAKEMWRFGPETESILRKYDELRYRLMPYLYSQAWKVTEGGGTIMRPLVMDFPSDPRCRDLKDQFMFGPSLMICPVVKAGATSRSVCLPSGSKWYDFESNRATEGGQTIVANAPIETMPIFVKAGSILALGPATQYVDEKPADPIDLRVFAGADAEFTLYEDDGISLDYTAGKRATIPIRWDQASQKLTIGARRGSFAGMLSRRIFRVEIVGGRSGQIDYDGKRVVF